jgi:hypothetical protein
MSLVTVERLRVAKADGASSGRMSGSGWITGQTGQNPKTGNVRIGDKPGVGQF